MSSRKFLWLFIINYFKLIKICSIKGGVELC